MINKIKLEEVVEDQLENFSKKKIGIPREVDYKKHLKTNQITVISGVRRSGKSTLLVQFSKIIKNFYYLNFDDERLLNFSVEDFAELLLVFQKKYKAKTLLFDEIQNVKGWERFVRRAYDDGYKIFVTGSNAKLLGSELATHLTGRYFKIDLFPFSFKEFLDLKKIGSQSKTTQSKAKILKYFEKYLQGGGFPDYAKYGDKEYLSGIYEDILYKDLLVRYKIRETKSFKQLASYAFSNFTKELSYNSMKKTLGFKSVTSVKDYIEYMQQSFFLFELYKYDFSLKKQYVSDKKIYVIDNGLRNSISFYFSSDKGRLLENLAFLELKRRGKEIYFYKDSKECDFLIKEKNKITEAIQVSYEISSEETETREEEGLFEAMKRFKLKEGLILTQSEEKEKEIEGLKIFYLPMWKWMLENEG
jgi:hypothetical protein